MNRLTRDNPQAVTRLEACVFQQAGATLGAAVGDFGGVSQHRVPSDVANMDFQAFRYSTVFEIARAGLSGCRLRRRYPRKRRSLKIAIVIKWLQQEDLGIRERGLETSA